MSAIIENARRYARLDRIKRRLAARTRRIEDEMRQLSEQLEESFIDEGVDQVKVSEGTVHIITETWSKLVVPEGCTEEAARLAVAKILEEMGLAKMVTYNHQSMRSLVIELADENGELPPPLGQFITAERRHRIGVRAAKK